MKYGIATLFFACATSAWSATATLVPTSIGSTDQWTCGGCNKVTQVTDADDCEFGGSSILSNSAGHKQRFLLSDLSVPSHATITSVSAWITNCRTGSLNGSWRLHTHVGSATNFSANNSSTLNCCSQHQLSLTEPNDSNWSIQDVQDLQLELENLTATNGTSVSDIRVQVEYTTPTPLGRRRAVLVRRR